ncbi:hypothetical protein VKT23_001437 [Stygiomarasmius scandens]|uniref:DUF6699 domain-containing protein n=1 Tax=Marasmiellus scandens TaxID=2682957 RepID=A0ABR1K0G0_9AGAR
MNLAFYPEFCSPRWTWPITTLSPPWPYSSWTPPQVVNVQYGPNFFGASPSAPVQLGTPMQTPLALPTPRQPAQAPFQVRPHPLLSRQGDNPYVHWDIINQPEVGADVHSSTTIESFHEQAFYYSRGEPHEISILLDKFSFPSNLNDWIYKWGPIKVMPNYHRGLAPLYGNRVPRFTIRDVLQAVWRYFCEPLTAQEIASMNVWYPGHLDRYRSFREQMILRRGVTDPYRVYRRSDILGQRIRFGGFQIVDGSSDDPQSWRNSIKLVLLDA